MLWQRILVVSRQALSHFPLPWELWVWTVYGFLFLHGFRSFSMQVLLLPNKIISQVLREYHKAQLIGFLVLSLFHPPNNRRFPVVINTNRMLSSRPHCCEGCYVPGPSSCINLRSPPLMSSQNRFPVSSSYRVAMGSAEDLNNKWTSKRNAEFPLPVRKMSQLVSLCEYLEGRWVQGRMEGGSLRVSSFPEEAEAVLSSVKGKSLGLALSWFFIKKSIIWVISSACK